MGAGAGDRHRMGNLGGMRLLCLWSFPDLPVTGGQDKKFKPQGGIIKTFLNRPLVWREKVQSPVLEAHHDRPGYA